jgi:hypothetical protein
MITRFVLALTIIASLSFWAHAAYAQSDSRGWVFVGTPTQGCHFRTNDIRALRLFVEYLDGQVSPADFIDRASVFSFDWGPVAERLVAVCGPEVKYRGERVWRWPS